MKTKKNALVFLLMISTSLSSFAKKVNDDMVEVKKRILIVTLLEEQDDALKALAKDPVKLKEYMKKVADYNTNVKKAVAKYWKQNKSIEYKIKSDVRKICEDKQLSKKYALLELNKFDYTFNSTKRFEEHPFFKKDKNEDKSDRVTVTLNVYLAELKNEIWSIPFYNFEIVDIKEKDYFFIQNEYNCTYSPTEGEVLNSVNEMNFLVEQFAQEKNPYGDGSTPFAKLLNGRTVLAMASQVGADFSKEIPDMPFKIKIVEKAEIEKLMLKPDPNFALIKDEKLMFLFGDNTKFACIVLPENGTVSFVTLSPLTVKMMKKSLKAYSTAK